MPIGDPADPLYAPYARKRGITVEERDELKERMKRDVDEGFETLRQENLNRIFAKLAELEGMMNGGRGEFPITVTTGQNGFIVSLDPGALKKLLSAYPPQTLNVCVNGFAGSMQVLGTTPTPFA